MPPPDEANNYPPELVEWIDSINKGFKDRKSYRKFDLYVAQAKQWHDEGKYFGDFNDPQEQFKFAVEESNKIQQNSLYYLNKYVYFKTGTVDNKYYAHDAQKIAAFLIDSGYCLMIGKARQIWFSTTIGAIAIKRINFNRRYFVKFIAENLTKTQEIFEDKIKYPFYHLEKWMQSTVNNDQEGLFRLMFKHLGQEKGEVQGADSKIKVDAPYETAVNGGSPDLVLMDEIGQMPLLGKMIMEGAPTLYQFDPVTGTQKRIRQLVAFGCVCAGTKVWNNKGRLINIEELAREDGIIGYNGSGYSKGQINWIAPPAIKPCYRIETSGGNYIECSNDHPLLWSKTLFRSYKRGKHNVKNVMFQKAEDIKIGDSLVMLDRVPVFGNDHIPYARLLGLLVGDGNYSANSTVQMSVADQEIRDYLNDNYKTRIYKSFELKDGRLFESVGIIGGFNFVERHQMRGQSFDNKRLPFDIHLFDEKSVCELLAGYYDADGNVYYNEKKDCIRIVLSGTNEELLREVKYQLIKLGIGSHITKEYRNSNNTKLSSGQKDYIYRLYINRHKDAVRFHDKIKLLCKHKQDALDKGVLIKRSTNIRNNDKADFLVNEKIPKKGEYFIDKTDMTNLRYDRVTKVEYIGEKEIYNLNVSDTHTYIANGYITANTGGEVDRGGAEFEQQFRAYLTAWNERKFFHGIIPIFFDCWARPGMSDQYYDQQKEVYYSKGSEDYKIKFHQHFPTSIEEMFLSSAETVIPISTINTNIRRINLMTEKNRKGIFEPVFDMSRKLPDNSIVPYAVVGAVFRPSGDFEDAPVTIFKDPEKDWIDRYFQGTDPINSESGKSNFASTIWDAYNCTASALINFRSNDYRLDYLQSYLMNIYYGHPMHLIESNVGKELINFTYTMDNSYRTIVIQNMLPQYLQINSAEIYGIRKVMSNSPYIYSKLTELLQAYKENIFIEDYFTQLKTFIKKEREKDAKIIYQTADYRVWKDDALHSLIYAYIAALCYAHRPPQHLANKDKKKRTRRMVCNASTNFRVEVQTVWT